MGPADGFEVQGSGFRVHSSEIQVSGSGFRVEGSTHATHAASIHAHAHSARYSTRFKIKLLRSSEKQFRGGLVCKARGLVVSLNSRQRVIKKKKKVEGCGFRSWVAGFHPCHPCCLHACPSPFPSADQMGPADGFEVPGSGFRVHSSAIRVSGFGFCVQG